jgi:mannose-6-phosphate isomerase
MRGPPCPNALNRDDGGMSLGLPLRFESILREYLWGGRRLEQFGKQLGAGDHYAESWEIVDHGADQSVVASGPLAGRTLHELVTDHGAALFGRHHPQPQFPLLFKLLDAQQTLSVQVHPNDEQAARLTPPDLGKTEAWVVLATEPGGKIYAGLKAGVDRAQLESAVQRGACDECLHVFEPSVGDCIPIEAGTVHAIGAGLVIAEIQQASDTTFRLFDWNRVDRDGKPRPLHVEAALNTIDFARGPVNSRVPQLVREEPRVERLVSCDKFTLDRWRTAGPASFAVDGRFHILSVIEGEVQLAAVRENYLFRRGDSVLVPADCAPVEFSSADRATLLDMYLP